MKTADNSILSEIEKSKGYEVALLTTYNFEVPFFEKYVYALLAQNNIRLINVFVDSKELNIAIEDASSDILGKKYYVTPIMLNSSFHPKVILLLGEDKAKLIISSANIKQSGYIHNNEVFNSFEYSKKDTQYASIIMSAIQFFKDLFDLSKNCDEDTRKKLNEYQLEEIANDTCSLLFNTRQPILSQVANLIDEKVIKTNIAVPFYDDSLEALSKIKEQFGCDNINLYIQNKANTFPIEFNEQNHVLPNEAIKVFGEVAYNKSKSFYHGKVIEFITDNHSYILYGSTNCSSSALTRTYRQNGNIECDVLICDEPGANIYFFDEFVLDTENKLENGFQTEVSESKSKLAFLYGETSDSGVILYFSGKPIKSTRAFLHEQELEVESLDNMLKIVVPFRLLANEGSIFDIDLQIFDLRGSIKCWYNDKYELNRNRYDLSEIGLADFDTSSDFGQYQEYIRVLFDKLYNNENWYKIAKGYTAAVAPVKNPDDVDEEDVDETYIIYTDGSNSYIDKKISYSIYKNASAFAGRYFNSITKQPVSTQKKRDLPLQFDYPKRTVQHREPTPTEKRFERVFKRHISKQLPLLENPDISYDECMIHSGIILDLIKMVKDIEGLDECFDSGYTTDIKSKIAQILLKKAIDENSEIDFDTLASFILLVLFERDYNGLNENETWASENMLYQLNQIKDIRDGLEKYIKNIDFGAVDSSEDQTVLQAKAIAHIERLYGYKTKQQLEEYLRGAFGNGMKLSILDKEIIIEQTVARDNLPFNGISDKHIQEINSYITGYKLHISRITITYYVAGSRDRMEYQMKTDGRNASQVYRKQYLAGNNLSFRCFLKNKIWKYEPHTRKKI